jgi:hypothetical protein
MSSASIAISSTCTDLAPGMRGSARSPRSARFAEIRCTSAASLAVSEPAIRFWTVSTRTPGRISISRPSPPSAPPSSARCATISAASLSDRAGT